MGLYYLQSRYYNPEVGRFLNADAFISTGQGVLGNNMFAYCGNNPVSRVDATGCAFVQINYNLDGLPNDLFPEIGGGCACALAAAGSISSALKKDISKQDGTTSRGITFSAAYIVAVAVSFGFTNDHNGNFGFYLTLSVGGGTPTAGISKSRAKTNAPTIFDQRGWGMSMGGSVSPVVLPISVGGEYNMLLNDQFDYTYSGFTTNVGAGIGLPAEWHGTIDHTWVKGWNKKEIWKWLFN